MKHTVDFGRVLLPQNEDSSACRLSDPGSACFLTGNVSAATFLIHNHVTYLN